MRPDMRQRIAREGDLTAQDFVFAIGAGVEIAETPVGEALTAEPRAGAAIVGNVEGEE
jgi:hypothetical protein